MKNTSIEELERDGVPPEEEQDSCVQAMWLISWAFVALIIIGIIGACYGIKYIASLFS